jgi:hypothetical protein
MDKYDEAMDYLTEYPEEIPWAWAGPDIHEAGCLFKFMRPYKGNRNELYGCLTMIRNLKKGGPFYVVHVALDDEMTEAIRADERIPTDYSDITVESLPAFAEWQRIADKWREDNVA